MSVMFGKIVVQVRAGPITLPLPLHQIQKESLFKNSINHSLKGLSGVDSGGVVFFQYASFQDNDCDERDQFRCKAGVIILIPHFL